MTAVVTTGMKIAEKSPGVVTKAAVVAGSIAVGAGAIIAKKAASSVVIDTKKKFISDTQLTDFLNNIFQLSGNNAIDLLNIIQYFNKLEFFFNYCIAYFLLLSYVNESKLEVFLLKCMPTTFVKWYIKSIILFKKLVKINLIGLLLLLLISNYCSYYYLEVHL